MIELPEVKIIPVELPEILKKIRQCESGGDYTAQNPVSTASGGFQFIDGTWGNYKGYAKAKLAPEHIQDEYALKIYNEQGTRPWNASKHCWSPITRTATNLTVNSGVSYGGAVTILDSGRPEYRNCVATVRMFHHYPQGGNPYATPIFINSQTPTVGAVAVQRGHVAIVVGYTDTTVTIKEGNFKPGYLTQRTVPRYAFLGYFI